MLMDNTGVRMHVRNRKAWMGWQTLAGPLPRRFHLSLSLHISPTAAWEVMTSLTHVSHTFPDRMERTAAYKAPHALNSLHHSPTHSRYISEAAWWHCWDEDQETNNSKMRQNVLFFSPSHPGLKENYTQKPDSLYVEVVDGNIRSKAVLTWSLKG